MHRKLDNLLPEFQTLKYRTAKKFSGSGRTRTARTSGSMILK